MNPNHPASAESTNFPSVSDTSEHPDEGWNVRTSQGNTSIFLIMYGIICFLGTTGNLLFCIVLVRVPSLRSNTSYFLIHLSIVDLLLSLMIIPNKLCIVTLPTNTGFLGELWCRLYVGEYIFWVCVLCSVFSLVIVNVERYIATVHPHRYKAVYTRRNKHVIVAFSWAIALICKLFILFMYGQDETFGCHFLGWPSPGVQVGVGIYSFLINLLIPFVVMATTQLKVICTLKKQVKRLSASTSTASSSSSPSDQSEMWQLRATQTLMRTLCIFVVTFVICWGPNQTLFLLYNLGVNVDFGSTLSEVTNMLTVCNSCLNPIIYITTNRKFRVGICKMLTRKVKPTQVEVGALETFNRERKNTADKRMAFTLT